MKYLILLLPLVFPVIGIIIGLDFIINKKWDNSPVKKRSKNDDLYKVMPKKLTANKCIHDLLINNPVILFEIKKAADTTNFTDIKEDFKIILGTQKKIQKPHIRTIVNDNPYPKTIYDDTEYLTAVINHLLKKEKEERKKKDKDEDKELVLVDLNH